MKAKTFAFCFAALTLLAWTVASEPLPGPVYQGALKQLKPPPSILGAQWVSANGVVIEDFADVQSHPAGERPVVEALKAQLEPIGVRKAAEFTFRLPDDPSRLVTLRVFAFESPELCAKWWEKKYRHDGWEKFYQPVRGLEYLAVDSIELPKRAVAIGNVWITCHSIKNPTDHLAVMNACIEKLSEAMKSKQAEPGVGADSR